MLLLPLVILFSVWCAHAKKDGPRISKFKFDSAPTNFFYFDDTDIILLQEARGNIWRSEDAGENWKVVEDIDEGQAWELWQHPHDNKIAYTLGLKDTHWVTHDQGETWASFETGEVTPSLYKSPLRFHAGDSNKVLLHGLVCKRFGDCEEDTYYTTDGFKSIERLRSDTKGCYFAHSTPLFKTSEDDVDDSRILCIVKGRYSPWAKDSRLVVSDNYFRDEVEPTLAGDRTVQGLIDLATVKGFIVTAAKAENTDELALYVTDDAKEWHRAEFPSNHKVEQEAYTILESTNYSIQVDVMTTKPSNPMGSLFTSNSNGTYFTENIRHTNRNVMGLVDFEKVQGIQGIVLVNVVDNWQEYENTGKEKKVQTKISFDDGRTFQSLTAEKKKNLHLHSVTDLSNIGRVFSSAAPGLVMGVGNTGDYRRDYDEGDLYVSDDAGLTWRKALDEAHKYEFGDQGSVLLAIYDEGPASEIRYSINHGIDWQKADLPGDKVRAKILTTISDSTSLKFVLQGTVGGGSKMEHYIYSIDFNGLHEAKCEEKDFEDWYARRDDDGEPSCLMGHTQSYRRRKADADCFVDEEFKDPQPVYKPCACTDKDFECDYNFIRSGEDKKKCVPVGTLPVPDGQCKSPDDKYLGSSGFRLIPGNDCIRKGSVELDKEIERPCSDSVKAPASGKISHEIINFRADRFKEYFYLERTESSHGEDETVIMRTDTLETYISTDHGKAWKRILEDEDILAIYPHQYLNDVVFFLTGTRKVFYSVNRGKNIESFTAPDYPTRDRLSVIAFHPDRKDWLIWTGAVNCVSSSKGECHSVASYTKDRGDHWETLLRYVRKCEFIKKEGRGGSEQLIYCEQFKDENLEGPLQLLSSENWFADSVTHFNDVVDFATMSEFIIVAARASDQVSLKVDASVDGKTFADAMFPNNFNVPVQRAYTVLDSSTHAVFLHVTVDDREDFEYGTIIKSNSNGTSYVKSVDGVNRNTPGYVDFEKMQGLEGVAIVNVVDNLKDTEEGQAKKLRTLITHNDGAQWAPLMAPKEDADGKRFECDVSNIDDCSLHLHGYTERKDPRDTFSSPTAVGLMMGVGNVGKYLTRKAEGDTFITRDGGITWKAVKKGNYMWEFGDQGSVVVIVEENAPTNIVFYSRDEGLSWTAYEFSDTKMTITDITTVPSDSSRNFLLWGKSGDGSKLATVNLDFSGLYANGQCRNPDDNPEDESGDYELWAPKHPLQDNNCLFGHIAEYHRKKLDADCYNGRKFEHLHMIQQNCSCTRQDFEW